MMDSYSGSMRDSCSDSLMAQMMDWLGFLLVRTSVKARYHHKYT